MLCAAWLLFPRSSVNLLEFCSLRGLLFCRGLGATLQVIRVHWQARGFALGSCAQVLDALCVVGCYCSCMAFILSIGHELSVLGFLQRIVEGGEYGTRPDIVRAVNSRSAGKS